MARNGFQRWVANFLGIEESVKENVAREVKESPVRQEITFDSFTGKTEERMMYRQLENSVWFRGIPEELELFYKTYEHPIQNLTSSKQNLFWQQVTGSNSKRLHYPLASAISRQMSAILFSDELKMAVDTTNKDRTDDYNSRITEIAESNEFRKLLQTAAMLESYSGGVAFKIVTDPEFSSKPIIQLYPQESVKVKNKYGKLFELVFMDEYRYADRAYKLYSTYGKGYIRYKLVDLSTNAQVPLNSIPQFENLKDVVFTDSNGEPMKLMMAVYKVNRPLSSEFSIENETLGASDYEGLASVFNELDAIFSAYTDYMVKGGRVFTFMTEDQLQRDSFGKPIKPNIYGLDVIPVYDSTTASDKKTEVKRDMPELRTESFRNAMRDLINLALIRVGLSSVTFSLDGVTTMMSRESLDAREKTTQKTREDKIKLWKETLAVLMQLMLVYEDMMQATPTEDESTAIYRVENDYADIKYLVEFPQFESPTRDTQIQMLSEAMKNKLVDIETAVRELYGDEKTEEELMQMVYNIKEENKIGQMEPMNQDEMDNQEQMEVRQAGLAADEIEQYARQNIPESDEDFGQFMYQAELIRSGQTDLAESELSKVSEPRRNIIRRMVE